MTPRPLGGSPPPALPASDAPAADARQSQLVLVRLPAWSRPRWTLVRTNEVWWQSPGLPARPYTWPPRRMRQTDGLMRASVTSCAFFLSCLRWRTLPGSAQPVLMHLNRRNSPPESQELTPVPQVRAGAGDAAARRVMKRVESR